MRETDLYPPVKAFFERRGYAVKGEIGAADLVAMRSGEEPVIVELKLRFTLALFHQAVARMTLSDLVYLAVLRPEGPSAARALADNAALCRRIGAGLLTVRARDSHVEVHCEPGDRLPRRSPARRARLLKEFGRRVGDPNDGGATRHGIVTGYRQDAIRCASYLAEYGPSRGAAVARDTGVGVATRIMADNHYGWFRRRGRGIYDLSEDGQRGLADWSDAIEAPPAAG
jgi:hypothetical protein